MKKLGSKGTALQEAYHEESTVPIRSVVRSKVSTKIKGKHAAFTDKLKVNWLL